MRKLDFKKWWIPDIDGSIDMIFGGLGSGKTYSATDSMLRDLNAGNLVYATWMINWDGVDERRSLFKLLLGMVGLKYTFKVIPKTNFHYVPINDPTITLQFARSIDAVWYVDEAYAFLDSYRKTKMSMAERVAIYATRHFNRRLVLVAQRPNSIHVSARAMVNRFYECYRPLPLIQTILNKLTVGLFKGFFIRVEYQDMVEETVDREKPASTRWYFARHRVFKAYNSKYMRGNAQPPEMSVVDKYRTHPLDIPSLIAARLRGKAPPAPAAPVPVPPYLSPLSVRSGVVSASSRGVNTDVRFP